MSSIKPIEKLPFEDLFGMDSGYVLDFSNRTFSRFFIETINLDIGDEKYSLYGTSKANRLRRFWDVEPDQLVGKLLAEMLEIWKYRNAGIPEDERKSSECHKIVSRLLGAPFDDKTTEQKFLDKDFSNISLKNLKSESSMLPILDARLREANQCVQIGASLAVIFLCGSILEGALLGVAQQNQKDFNQSELSPKDSNGAVKKFHYLR